MGQHLPQGAPTSPALANLCAYRLDLRLAGAARECQTDYSRCVDDLVFSCAHGNLVRGRRIVSMVQEIILEEGFSKMGARRDSRLPRPPSGLPAWW